MTCTGGSGHSNVQFQGILLPCAANLTPWHRGAVIHNDRYRCLTCSQRKPQEESEQHFTVCLPSLEHYHCKQVAPHSIALGSQGSFKESNKQNHHRHMFVPFFVHNTWSPPQTQQERNGRNFRSYSGLGTVPGTASCCALDPGRARMPALEG